LRKRRFLEFFAITIASPERARNRSGVERTGRLELEARNALRKGTYSTPRRSLAEPVCPVAAIIGHQGDLMKIEILRLEPHEWIPNHPSLPVVLYRNALMPTYAEATACGFDVGRRLSAPDPRTVRSVDSRWTPVTCPLWMFQNHGWPPQWRNGVYDYHHYHSTAHEVLGFASGSARVILGGQGGTEVTVNAGDAVLLPAGAGHCRLQASADFLVVGAYPPGQDFDICRSAPSQGTLIRIASLGFPGTDPITGDGGPWQAGRAAV
jgi:uncharacterized protein YjlB